MIENMDTHDISHKDVDRIVAALRHIQSGVGSMAMNYWGEKEERHIQEAIDVLGSAAYHMGYCRSLVFANENETTADAIRRHLNDARAKDAELIQMLVDALEIASRSTMFDYDDFTGEHYGEEGKRLSDAALAAAAAAGFKPSDQ